MAAIKVCNHLLIAKYIHQRWLEWGSSCIMKYSNENIPLANCGKAHVAVATLIFINGED
jgi:hypothetical protein